MERHKRKRHHVHSKAKSPTPKTRENEDKFEQILVSESRLPPFIALQQCNDIILLQEALLHSLLLKQKETSERHRSEKEEYEEVCKQLDAEKIKHTKTKCHLSMEQEKAQLAQTEVQVLTKQLSREKATFEKAFGLLKSQALADSTKSESLVAKCTGLEALVQKKEESIQLLESRVQDLVQQIKDLKKAHKMELQEAYVRTQQEIYLSKQHREMESDRRKTGHIKPSRTRTKLKDS